MTRTKKIVLVVALSALAVALVTTGGVFCVKKHKAAKALPVKEA